jgi:predicted transcriptional regulator of viral defense system
MARDAVLNALRDLGGTGSAKQLIQAGARWPDLYRLRDEGEISELSRGIYRLADSPPTAHLDLLAVSRRVPHGVICLQSAASYWDLTDDMPAQVHIAVPRGRRRPSIRYPRTRAHFFAVRTFELERLDVHLESGERIAMYSPERTVVDLMRLRHAVGRDQALGGLRRYLDRNGARPGRLLEIARELRAGTAVAEALEPLLA